MITLLQKGPSVASGIVALSGLQGVLFPDIAVREARPIDMSTSREGIEMISTAYGPSIVHATQSDSVVVMTDIENEPLSVEALQALRAGLKSGRELPPVSLGSFLQYADDD